MNPTVSAKYIAFEKLQVKNKTKKECIQIVSKCIQVSYCEYTEIKSTLKTKMEALPVLTFDDIDTKVWCLIVIEYPEPFSAESRCVWKKGKKEVEEYLPVRRCYELLGDRYGCLLAKKEWDPTLSEAISDCHLEVKHVK